MSTVENQFTYSPHLQQYALPLRTFAASNPQHTHFIVGGHIYTTTPSSKKPEPAPEPKTKVLLLRRSIHDSLPGYWEGPGGLCEPTDSSILCGAAREVYEETGLHVSRFVELIAKDEWTRVKNDELIRAAKFTFWVEVKEAEDQGEEWKDRVRLEPEEHEAFVWATEEEVVEGVKGEEEEDGKLKFVGDQGKTLLRGFQMYEQRE